MLPARNSEWEYFKPNEYDNTIHGMERILDNGTAIDVVAYGTYEAPGEFSWLIRLWDEYTQQYSVHASYDNDIYFDDLEEAYDDLTRVLQQEYPDLICNDEISYDPPSAKNKFFAKIAAIGLAAALMIPALTGCGATTAYSSARYDYNDVSLGTNCGAVEYSQLLSMDHEFEQYDACVDIMLSGANPDVNADEGWYDGDFRNRKELTIDVLNYAAYDNPICSLYKTGADDGIGLTFSPETGDFRIFSKATEEGDNFNNMYQQVDRIAQNMNDIAVRESNGSTADFVYSVLDQVTQHCSYSFDDTSSAHCNDIYGCLVSGSSRCYGYASAVKYILDMQGIPNFIATGYSGPDRHAWNMVDIGGVWIVVDATYSRDMMVRQNVSSLSDCANPRQYCSYTMDTLNDRDDAKTYIPDAETYSLLQM